MKLLNIKTFVVVAIVAVAAAVVYSNYASSKANEGIELSPNIKGNPDAAVVLTEFSDFQCPACAQFYPILKDLLEQYEGDLALEYKHFPLINIHPFAVPAAKAAEAAGQQGKFFEMHDKLFENQTEWSQGANPRAFFMKYAEELELDMDQFKRQYGASLIEDKIQAEFNEARENGFTGTPSFLLNGERLQFGSFEEFNAAIRNAIGTDDTETEEGVETGGAEPAAEDVRFGF